MEVHGGELSAVLGSKGMSARIDYSYSYENHNELIFTLLINKTKLINQYCVVLWLLKLSNIFLGSGKRALFEVISRRAQGPTRGQILLNGVPMSMRLFQVRTHELFLYLRGLYFPFLLSI